MEIVFGEIAQNDDDRLLGGLVDKDGFLVCVEGILQHCFVELTIGSEVP